MSTKGINLMDFGSALGREEMRKLMAGSGSGSGSSCMETCQDIAYACFGASAGNQGSYDSICRRQFQCCAGMCMNYGC